MGNPNSGAGGRYIYLTLSALAATGVIAVLFATRWGIGNASDASTYLGVARNLLNGRGLSIPFGAGEPTPMTHYPPLFPTLLAMTGLVGFEPASGARWLQGVLFGANILLVGHIVWRYTRGAFAASVFASGLMLSSPVVFHIHCWAFTEPLFIFLALLGFLFLAEHLETPKTSLLLASSCALALTFLARYSGAAVIGASLVGILLFSRKELSGRIRDSALLFAASSLPMAVWVTRNRLVAGTAANREMAFHPLTLSHVKYALHTISTWILPPGLQGPAGGVLLLAGLACLVAWAAVRPFGQKPENRGDDLSRPISGIPHLSAVFVVVYAAFLAVSISLFDAHTTPDNRILSPIYVFLAVPVVCAAHRMRRQRQGVAVKTIVSMLCIVVIGVNLHQEVGWMMHARDGLGYNGPAWMNSKLTERIRALPPETPVFTNGADAVYMLTGRNSISLPRKVHPATRRINHNYFIELDEMREQMERSGGLLVYFDSFTARWYLPSKEELEQHLPLSLVAETPEGSMYGVKHP